MTHLSSPHDAYELLKQIGDGSFGTVYKARHKESRKPVAIKVMKKKYNCLEECEGQFEPKLLHLLPKHSNIVQIHDSFLTETTHDLSFVMEFMDSGNLYQLMRERKQHNLPFNNCELRNILYQVLSAVSHIHHHNIFHRDMKPENLLLDYTSGRPVIKLADFGLAREIDSKPPFTEYVSTRWYRAPEVLLRSTEYSAAVDLWALGAIFAELITFEPLFPGDSEIDQIFKICEILGSPGNKIGVVGQKSNRIARPEKRISPGFARKKAAEPVEKTTPSTLPALDGGGEWKEGVRLAYKIGFKFPHFTPKPLESVIPNATESMLDIIRHFLFFNPQQRRSADAALKLAFFTEIEDTVHKSIPLDSIDMCPEWDTEDRDSFYGRLCSAINDDRLSSECETNVDRLLHNPENDGYLSQTRPIYSSHEKVHPLFDQDQDPLHQKRDIYSSHQKTHPVTDKPGSSQVWNKYGYSSVRPSTPIVDRIHSSRGLTSSSGKHNPKEDDAHRRLSTHILHHHHHPHHNDYHIRHHGSQVIKWTAPHFVHHSREQDDECELEEETPRPKSRHSKRLSTELSGLSLENRNHLIHSHSHLLNSWGPEDEDKGDQNSLEKSSDRCVHVS